MLPEACDRCQSFMPMRFEEDVSYADNGYFLDEGRHCVIQELS